jgi:hypothetical protein
MLLGYMCSNPNKKKAFFAHFSFLKNSLKTKWQELKKQNYTTTTSEILMKEKKVSSRIVL